MSNIKIKLDGKDIVADSNKTILQIAEENGIQIPTLCHNQKVSRTTSCFVCVVKDAKTGRFLPSCSSCPVEGQEIESSSEEVRDMRKTALELLLSEHAGDCEAPCTVACPAHANVEEYVRAGRQGDFLESLKIIKERIPLPMSIGRVCPRFCEKDCRKNVTGKPVAINDFKRLAADMYYESYMEDLPPVTGKKVAVVGAGPAGLATAYYLRRNGVESVVYDKMPKPGGMLRYGIPEYRLPKSILDTELAHFTKMGIQFECNRKLGDNLTMQELKDNFDAIAVTIGCWKPGSMRCEGEELAVQGIEWLEKIALADWSGENPGKVIVVGGGNTAMDCLRTSVRLGSSDVNCFYRRTEAEMPAEEIEIMEAKEEDVKFSFLTAPVKLREEDGKLIMTCIKMELGEPDASGRRRPIPVEGSEYDVEADCVIAAIGQKTDAPEDIRTNKWGDIDVCEETYHLEENVFAAGDCVTGAATVVEGVAGGRKIALGIVDFLTGSKHKPEYQINVSRGHWRSLANEDLVYLREDVSEEPRVDMEFIPLEERKSTFKEVCETLPKEKMMAEGERCIECSCTAKGDCKLKKFSEEYTASPDTIKGEKIKSGYDNRHPAIIHDRNKCIKCGICVKVCKEVVNANLLSAKLRGFSTKVETAFGQQLPISCKDCGKCISECPVGALDWKIKE
ncbi:MAG: FAD-dependent oxidoreductase [Lentisphaerae bacterium]|nr:FAD-dependent oxidoreductase [Lentisphaerota bacterium]MCP4102688.1 FAD-dependent oxidoreductase [Lentisphaerota bacterium]